MHTGTAAWLRGPPGARCIVGGAGVSPEVTSVSVVCLRIGDGDRCSRVGIIGIHGMCDASQPSTRDDDVIDCCTRSNGGFALRGNQVHPME